MRFRAIVSWAMTVSFLLSATPDGAAADVTPQTLKSGEILRGRFVQERQLAGFAKPLRTTGTFALVPGRGLIWRALTPFQDTTVITPDGILGQVNGRETMRLPASRVPGLGHLYEVLGGAVSGNTAPLEQTFDVKRSDLPESWRLLLTPLHPDNPAMSQIKSSATRRRKAFRTGSPMRFPGASYFSLATSNLRKRAQRRSNFPRRSCIPD
jgi:hypothetical protein